MARPLFSAWRAGVQCLAGRLGLLLAEEVEGLPEGVGRLGRAGVREQLGLLAQGGAIAGSVGDIVDV